MFTSRRKIKLAFRNHRTFGIRLEWLTAILLLWLTPFPLTAVAQQKESHKSMKAIAVPIDINRATAKDFAKLPGVGPELARRIVDYRSKHGTFHRVEDLLAIRGIGPRKWRALKPYLRVEQKTK
ncbi:MAG TPA: helix-hairpin-helix domain-containing protein [Terriglobia bacterium]|nr:helix-hairpin-helix domain-containing protein [Terriglobia bacterium]